MCLYWKKSFRIYFQYQLANSVKLNTNYPWMKGIPVSSNDGTVLLLRGDNHKHVK
jgi:hypothetical protein